MGTLVALQCQVNSSLCVDTMKQKQIYEDKDQKVIYTNDIFCFRWETLKMFLNIDDDVDELKKIESDQET